MTFKQAQRWLRRAQRNGYVAYHKGIVYEEGRGYGVNIDGDGREGRLFGNPEIFWTQDQIIDFFAARGVYFKPYVS